jgi:dsRNA-specific ribonuclease
MNQPADLTLPALPVLPNALPSDLYKSIADRYLVTSSTAHKWINLSFFHISYLHELGSPIGIGMLDALKDLGAHVLRLMGFHITNRDHFLSPAHVFDYSQRITRAGINTIATDLEFSKHGLFSAAQRTSPNHPSPALIERMASQFVGALHLFGAYSAILDILARPLPADGTTSGTETPDYKSRLLEYTQSHHIGPAIYTIVETSGPEHNKTFRMRVATGKSHWAEGSGDTKKAAGQAAARAYFAKYVPDSTKYLSLSSNTKGSRHSQQAYSPLHSAAELEPLRLAFSLPSSSFRLLSQSLTHRSKAHEMPGRVIAANENLAQLGAYALWVIVWQVAIPRILLSQNQDKSFRDHTKAAAALLKADSIAELFDAWALDQFVLVGKGLQNAGLNVTVRANFAQALIGAALMTKGRLGPAEPLVPKETLAWIERKLDSVVSDPQHLPDAKNRLQEYLQLLRIGFRFETIHYGPAHDATFRASIHLTLSTEKVISYGLGLGHSRRSAEQAIATKVVRILNEINGLAARGRSRCFPGGQPEANHLIYT